MNITTQLPPRRHVRETGPVSPQPPSAVSGPWPIALDSVVSRLQASELRLRAEQATQVALFAEALDQASPDHFATVQAGRLVHEHAQAELVYRSIRAELACALSMSEQTVERRMSHAYELTTCYPDTYLALRVGEIGVALTEVITAAGRVITNDLTVSGVTRRTNYETAVLAHARIETPARLRPIARRLAEQYADHTLDERHAIACERRRVWVTDHDDGMSDLTAYLPTIEAHTIYDRLTRASKQHIERETRATRDRADSAGVGVDAGAAFGATAVDSGAVPEAVMPPRTRDQVRSDLFSEVLRTQGEQLLHGTNPASQTGSAALAGQADSSVPAGQTVPVDGSRTPTLGGVQAHIQIFVTDETLFADTLRLDDGDDAWGAPTSLAPAELAGGGPIDTRSAKQLAAAAPFWDLARLHPVTGAVLRVERYRPSEQIRRTLRARDLHCRFPGCRAPMHRCDLDHTIDAAKGGSTSTTNLAHLCRGHHVLKHHGGWHVTQTSDGAMHWRSPTGRAYDDRPPSRVRFEQAPPSPPNVPNPPSPPNATPSQRPSQLPDPPPY